MFGSTNPFGHSTNSPFGSPSVFGQQNNASNNPFASKPFGSPTPFGSQTSGSFFGSTATGVFGATQAAPSTPAFGASSTPAFGSSPFGSSTPAFGSSLFGQKPAFGGFGSSPSQTSPFGGTFQSQPTFGGSSVFGSPTPFGAASQPAFGAASTPTFGATSTPAFGASTTPTFGAPSTPAFGTTSTSPFGSTGSAFGISSTPIFGASSTPAFGATSTPAFGVSSTPAFGASSTPAFGASSTPAFGATTSASFGFGTTPAFGQSTSAFGSTPFGTTSFGAQSSPFGAQTTIATFGSPGFGQTAFGGQQVGSRVVPYSVTPEADGALSGQTPGKLESISAMPQYKEKSHEELRWEDYQKGDKGGPNPSAQPNFGQPTQPSPFSTSAFGQTTSNPFSSTSTGLFGSKPAFGSSAFGASSASSFSSPFGSASTSPFGSQSSSSIFGASSTPAFGAASTSPFGVSSTPAFASSSPSLFGSTAAASTPAFGSGLTFGSTQSSGLFQSPSPSLGQTSIFGQTSAFGQSTSAFGQSNPFGTPSTGFGTSLFNSSLTPSTAFGQTAPSFQTGFQPTVPTQPSGAFSFGNFGQTQPAAPSGFGGMLTPFGQNTFGQLSASQSAPIMQPCNPSNPFGILPAMPQISIGRQGTSASVQYGISSMPVVDKPPTTRISPLLISRHISQRSRISLPSRRYHPKKEHMVSFFSDEEIPATPKAHALFIPRENPRALIINPLKHQPSALTIKNKQLQQCSDVSGDGRETDVGSVLPPLEDDSLKNSEQAAANNISVNVANGKSTSVLKDTEENGVHDEQNNEGNGYISISGNRAGDAALVFEYGAGIEALMPKLRHSDYYTEPKIQELAAKERAEPGYCKHVKDFVVGRRGFGSIRFFGETDVRRLDIESIVQFNNREVIVYMDGVKKPPVGQGLNKPGEVCLLNVRCVDKKTGETITQGPLVEKYTKMLRKKSEDQGVEFVSFDPVKGEWKFKVDHFSRYGLS